MTIKFPSAKTIFLFSLAFAIIAGSVTISATPAYSQTTEQQLKVDQALIILNKFLSDPGMTYFQKNIKNARGVLLIPNMLKGAFFVGGSGGRGVLMVRDPKTNQWSGPAFYTLGGGSFGLQFGGQSADIMMLITSQRGIESLYTSNFKLGGNVSVAAGPVGAGAEASTPLNIADFISFAYNQGAFVGFALDGTVISVSESYNSAYYMNKARRPTDIFVRQKLYNPGSAKLRDRLQQASK